jgi:cytochrome P450
MATDIADRFEALLFGGDADVNAFYRDARNDAPIFWSDAFNGWVVSKYDDAYRVLHDEEHFGPLSGGGGSTVIHGRTILHMEGVEHRRKSAILAKYMRSGPKRFVTFARRLPCRAAPCHGLDHGYPGSTKFPSDV